MHEYVTTAFWGVVFIVYFVISFWDLKNGRKAQKRKEEWYANQEAYYKKQISYMREENNLLRAEVITLVYSIGRGLPVDISAISESEDMEDIETPADILDEYVFD